MSLIFWLGLSPIYSNDLLIAFLLIILSSFSGSVFDHQLEQHLRDYALLREVL